MLLPEFIGPQRAHAGFELPWFMEDITMKRQGYVIAVAFLLGGAGCGNTIEMDACGQVAGHHLLSTAGFPDSVHTLIPDGLSLRAGTTYAVYVCAALGAGPFSSNPATREPLAVSFVVYNGAHPDRASELRALPGTVARIGTIRVSGNDWGTYLVARWTADADYHGVACVIEPGASDPGAIRIGTVDFQD